MNRPLIQIYEIQTPDEAEKLAQLGVDRIGSVITSQKQWKLPLLQETIQRIAASGAASSLIPLFSDLSDICRAIDYYRPDIIHFCEALDSPDGRMVGCLIDLQNSVKERFPQVSIMRSIPIAQTGMAQRVPTLAFAERFVPVSDLLLTDTMLMGPDNETAEAPQPVQGFVGITGRVCDWQMARKLVDVSPIPVVLAGGITPENVRAGIDTVQPFGVDSCTGTNATDAKGHPIRFKKDLKKVRRLVDAVCDAHPQGGKRYHAGKR